VLVYNLNFQSEELQVSGRQTLEDLIQQLRVKHPKLTGTTPLSFSLERFTLTRLLRVRATTHNSESQLLLAC